MIKRILQIGFTILFAGLFLWLAFRKVDLSELWAFAKNMQWGWIPPFFLIAIVSHYLRAERWKLLLEKEKKDLDRVTLFSGVMAGYLTNLVLPRVGELTRPMYVAKREELSSSKLIGTIVLERVIDISTMALLMLIISVYLIADNSLLGQIFGRETVEVFEEGLEIKTWMWILGYTAAGAGGMFGGWKFLELLGNRIDRVGIWLTKAKEGLVMFKEGLLSIRDVRRWWLFIIITALIWVGYTLMSFIPFWMFDLQESYGLGFLDALIITVISAVGIALPSPGGLGTYHYFVRQTMLVLFGIPAVTGLAYATITHATTVIFVVTTTPVILSIDKFRATRLGKEL